MQNKMVKKEPKTKPVEMETGKVDREGNVGLDFNQKMQVPSIITQKKDKTGKRKLYL